MGFGVPIVALGVPIADTMLAMIRRIVRHRPIFSADHSHIHHKLLDLGLSQREAVLILYAVSILLGGVALLLTVASSLQSAILLGAMGVLAFAGVRKLGYGRLGHGAASPEEIDIRRQLDRLAATSDEERLWSELKATAQAYGWAAIRLSLLCQGESDSISIQRTHGDWDQAEGASGGFEAKAKSAGAKIEFRAAAEVGAAAVEALRQATASAFARIFGKEPEARVARAKEEAPE